MSGIHRHRREKTSHGAARFEQSGHDAPESQRGNRGLRTRPTVGWIVAQSVPDEGFVARLDLVIGNEAFPTGLARAEGRPGEMAIRGEVPTEKATESGGMSLIEL